MHIVMPRQIGHNFSPGNVTARSCDTAVDFTELVGLDFAPCLGLKASQLQICTYDNILDLVTCRDMQD